MTIAGNPARLCLALASLCLGAVFVEHPAHAQESDASTRASARQLGNTGVEAYQAGDYKTASDKLEKAYRILNAPSLGLWSARALKANGKYVEASERYLEVTRLEVSGGDVALQKKAQADAAAELEELRAKIPSLVIEVKGASAGKPRHPRNRGYSRR
jgi:Tfp pilus assembly protein PilF